MTKKLLDSEAILSINDQWMELEEKWGIPIDLESEDDFKPSRPAHQLSSLDLRTSTFDSSFILKKVRRKLGRQISDISKIVDYKEFIEDLEKSAEKDVPKKEFRYINGEIMSAVSIEEICDKIDDIFKSFDDMSVATSTIRETKHTSPKLINFSDSNSLTDEEKEKSDGDDVDRFIDEAFKHLYDTINTIPDLNESTQDSVTTLVKKFTSVMESPVVNKSLKRKKECCHKFRELVQFWNSEAFSDV